MTDTTDTIRVPADDPTLPAIGTHVEPPDSVPTDDAGRPAEIDQSFVAVVDANFIVVGYMRIGCGQPDTPLSTAEPCGILDAEGSVIGHFVDGRPVIDG